MNVVHAYLVNLIPKQSLVRGLSFAGVKQNDNAYYVRQFPEFRSPKKSFTARNLRVYVALRLLSFAFLSIGLFSKPLSPED